MKTNYDNSLLQKVMRMGIEAKSHYNDGWVMGGYKKQLLEIRDYINSLFPDDIEPEYPYNVEYGTDGILHGPGMNKVDTEDEINPNQLNLFE